MANMSDIEDLSPDYDPLKDSNSYMNSKQLAYFKKLLTEWREKLIGESRQTLEHLQNEDKDIRSSDEVDAANTEAEILVELRTRDRYRKLINKIDKALLRIETKEYGYCEETGEEIGIPRLLARPIATLCIEAQKRHELKENLHEEEEHFESFFQDE